MAAVRTLLGHLLSELKPVGLSYHYVADSATLHSMLLLCAKALLLTGSSAMLNILLYFVTVVSTVAASLPCFFLTAQLMWPIIYPVSLLLLQFFLCDAVQQLFRTMLWFIFHILVLQSSLHFVFIVGKLCVLSFRVHILETEDAEDNLALVIWMWSTMQRTLP